MKLYKQARKYGRQIAVAGAGVGAMVASGLASAVGGVDISAATATATTDVQTAGGLVLGVVVAVAAFAWIRRVVH